MEASGSTRSDLGTLVGMRFNVQGDEMKPGYVGVTVTFTAAFACLVIAAIFHRATGGAIVAAGLLIACASLLVAANIRGAGDDFSRRYATWLNRWIPWLHAPMTPDVAVMRLVGGIGMVLGIFVLILGVLIMVGAAQ